MSGARAIRLRVARHYERVLARADQLWDGGEAARALRDLEDGWSQIHAQFGWLREPGGADPELRALAAGYALAGRRSLRTHLPAAQRLGWFELLHAWAQSQGERTLAATAHCELAICAHELGQTDTALERAAAAWALVAELPEPRLQADVLWARGLAEHTGGQDRVAVDSFTRSLELRRALLGADHPDVAEALNGLSYAWSDLEEHEKVIELLTPVAPLGDAPAPREHARLAATYRVLGTAFSNCGDLERAERCCVRALELDQRILAPGHRDLAVDWNDLATVRRGRGDLRGALECAQQALAIDEKCFGEQHPATALHLHNLGVILRELGEPAQALRALRRAQDTCRAVFGARHPAIANVLGHIGRCLLDLGEAGAALESLQDALALRCELAQGEAHPKFAADAESLAAARALQAQRSA